MLNSKSNGTQKENLLFEDAVNALKTRKKLEPGYKTQWQTYLKKMLSKCCRGYRLKDEEWHYLKAQDRIDYEFDIEHLIKNVRLLKNAFKFLTTKRERRLVRMQADKNVIVLREEDKKILLGDGKKELVDDSSDFFSHEYESYV